MTDHDKKKLVEALRVAFPDELSNYSDTEILSGYKRFAASDDAEDNPLNFPQYVIHEN